MGEKRKDSNGKVLREGESQRKDGRYMYRYNGINGKRKSIYARTLTELRSKIAQIERDKSNNIQTTNITLNQLFNIWFNLLDIKQSTKSNYLTYYNNHIKNILGNKKIKEIKYSDVLNLYKLLLKQKSLKIGTIKNVHKVIHSLFELAIRDNLILKNPSNNTIKEIQKYAESQQKNESNSERCFVLTKAEQTAFITFVKTTETYSKWLPLFTVLLGTGCRISEALGLTWNDIDFKNNLISINHILTYYKENQEYKQHISTPKTKNSVRVIPMFNDVRKCLLRLKKEQSSMPLSIIEIDGYSNFIFINSKGNVRYKSEVWNIINEILNNYNEQETKNAKNENRIPVLINRFSPHTFRHTFATRLYENGVDMKTIQSLLGHSSISITMNIYTHISTEKIEDVFKQIQDNFKIS